MLSVKLRLVLFYGLLCLCFTYRVPLVRKTSSKYLFALRSSLDSADAVLDKPKWAAGGPISTLVNALISFKPLFYLMKIGARKTLIETAEKNGVPWTERRQSLEAIQPLLEEKMAIISEEDNGLDYPDYYLNEFHAYDAGNLEWKAAMECESATMSMALRVWPKDGLTAEEAQNRLRYSYIDAAKKYAPALVTADAPKILDIGCSVGMSTFYLQDGFPQASLTGLDLSPYFLAVAQHRADTSSDGKYKSIEWKHGLAEDSKLKAASFDMVTASYLFHELTDAAATAIIAEMFRVVKPGGTVAITDNNPKSPVIQNLPAPIFTLMKSTEPWSDQYYIFNIEAALSRAGFTNVHTTDTDPRHRGIFATKPLKS